MSFHRYKVEQKSQNSRNQGFSYCFCLLTDGPDLDPYLIMTDPDPEAQNQTDLDPDLEHTETGKFKGQFHFFK
jgi:hypothetical protein